MMPLVFTQASAWSNVARKSVPAAVFTVSDVAMLHPLAQLLAEAIDLAVVGAHPFAHDPRRHADHVRVADPPPLDYRDDGHARAELTFLRLHAEDAGVGVLECVEDRGRRDPHRPRRHGFDQQRTRVSAAFAERLLERGGHVAARLVGDQRHVLARLDAEADFYRIRAPRRGARLEKPQRTSADCTSRLPGNRQFGRRELEVGNWND